MILVPLFRCLLYDFVYFFTFINNGITSESTSKQNVKRYISTSGVYTQIKPRNVTRIDQSASFICVKTCHVWNWIKHQIQSIDTVSIHLEYSSLLSRNQQDDPEKQALMYKNINSSFDFWLGEIAIVYKLGV